MKFPWATPWTTPEITEPGVKESEATYVSDNTLPKPANERPIDFATIMEDTRAYKTPPTPPTPLAPYGERDYVTTIQMAEVMRGFNDAKAMQTRQAMQAMQAQQNSPAKSACSPGSESFHKRCRECPFHPTCLDVGPRHVLKHMKVHLCPVCGSFYLPGDANRAAVEVTPPRCGKAASMAVSVCVCSRECANLSDVTSSSDA